MILNAHHRSAERFFREYAITLIVCGLVLAGAVPASAQQSHTELKDVHLTIARSASADHRPIEITRQFDESVSRVVLVFHNRGDDQRRLEIKIIAEEVEGYSPNAEFSSGWVRIPAGQRASITVKAPRGGFSPGTYRVVLRSGATALTRFDVTSQYSRAEILTPEADAALGPNIALSTLGGRVEASSQWDGNAPAARLIDGFATIRSVTENDKCENCGWATSKTDTNPWIVLDLPREAELGALVFDTRRFVKPGRRLDDATAWLPRNLSISVASDGAFRQVAKARLQRDLARQLVQLPAGLRANRVRIDVLDNHGGSGGALLTEIEVREQAGTAVSVLDMLDVDLAHPGLGGTVVSYTGFDSANPAWRLFDGDLSSIWGSANTYFPQDFTIAFHGDRVADVDRIEIGLSEASGTASWPAEIAISVSDTGPLAEAFDEVKRYPVAQQSGVQAFPVGARARFIKLRILDNQGAARTAMSALRVIEASGASALTENGGQGDAGADASNGRADVALTEQEPNDTRTTANQLKDGEVAAGKIDPLGETDYYALPSLGPEATALTFAYYGRPNIRHSLELLDGQGTVLHSFDPGGRALNEETLSFALYGAERFARLSEPASSVVVIWDTSGSMRGSEVDLERAVRDYIRRAPDNQAIQLIRFSDQVAQVTDGFLTEKTQLNAALSRQFRPDGGTRLYDAIAEGLDQLDRRAGNRGIVVMTDGADNGALWHDELWQRLERDRIRIYTIGLGRGLDVYAPHFASTGQRILSHLAQATGGESYFASDSAALVAFYSRIADQLASPAAYTLTPKIEYGVGKIRLVSTAEQVPSAAMPAVHVILDVSGSMAERLGDGRTRIGAGKESMYELLDFLPEGMPFGLTVYGARIPERPDKARACTDIVTVKENGPLLHRPVRDFIGNLRPRGGTTPLTRSVAHVVQNFKSKTGGIIVAVTDGIEECDPTPLVTVEQLKSQGLDKIELNVLGFDLRDRATKDMMEKIAAIGGGRYYEAGDGAALASALKEAISASYDVIDSGGRTVASGKIDGPSQDLPPGYYTVVIRAASAARRTHGVRIERDLTTVLSVNKVGQEMDIRVGAPVRIVPSETCGLNAIKRPSGKPRITRIQAGLTALGYAVGGADGIAGGKTRNAVADFAERYGVDLSIDSPLLLEQHIDCVRTTGLLFKAGTTR